MEKWLGIVTSCGEFDRNYAEFGTIDVVFSCSSRESLRYYVNRVTKRKYPQKGDLVFCEVKRPKEGEKRKYPQVTKVFLASLANESDYQDLFLTYFGENAKTAEKIFYSFDLTENPEELKVLLDGKRKGLYLASTQYYTLLNQKIEQYLDKLDNKEEPEEMLNLLVLGVQENVIGMPLQILWKYPEYFLKNPEKNLPYWDKFLRMVFKIQDTEIEITSEYCRRLGEISVQHDRPTIFREPMMRARLNDEDLIDWYRTYEKTMSDEMKRSLVIRLPENILEVLPEAEAYASHAQVLHKVECENRRKIRQILKERKISCFVHFTDLQNLQSILEQGGLMTRQELEGQNADFFYTDEQRIDYRRDSLSLSVSFPNYRMFYKKRQENPERKWCVLELDAEKIMDKLLIINSENAAAFSNRSKEITEEGCAELFASLFAEKQGEYERKELPSQYVTNAQAEILCLEKIPLQDIICCYFDFDEKKSVKEPYQKLLAEAGIRTGNSRKYFSYGPYLQYHMKKKEVTDGTEAGI